MGMGIDLKEAYICIKICIHSYMYEDICACVYVCV